jgi:hypothetical protein
MAQSAVGPSDSIAEDAPPRAGSFGCDRALSFHGPDHFRGRAPRPLSDLSAREKAGACLIMRAPPLLDARIEQTWGAVWSCVRFCAARNEAGRSVLGRDARERPALRREARPLQARSGGAISRAELRHSRRQSMKRQNLGVILGDSRRRHRALGRLAGILDERQSAEPSDGTQAIGAVVAAAAQDYADDPRSIGRCCGYEERIDGRTGPVDHRSGVEMDDAWLDQQHVAVRRRHVEPSSLQPIAVMGEGRRQLAVPGEDLRQVALTGADMHHQ